MESTYHSGDTALSALPAWNTLIVESLASEVERAAMTRTSPAEPASYWTANVGLLVNPRDRVRLVGRVGLALAVGLAFDDEFGGG